MFIVRYLMTALVVMAGILVWGITAGYSAWAIAGMTVLAVLGLQALVLACVAFAAVRKSHDPSRSGRKRSGQLVILPR